MMFNTLRGEIEAELDGRPWTLCLTLGSLAMLENALEVSSLNELSEKFSSGKMKASELTQIIYAGLMGGGHSVTFEEVADMRVQGGISGYVDITTRLLQATFSSGDDE